MTDRKSGEEMLKNSVKVKLGDEGGEEWMGKMRKMKGRRNGEQRMS